jgi:ATP-dependent Clp protease, protease subunit
MEKIMLKNLLLLLSLTVAMHYGFAQELKTIVLTDKNTVSFNEEFNSMSVAKKQVELFELAASSPEKDLYLVMNSPGGSVFAGSLFIDTVRSLNKNVHTITVFSASMGYHTVQGLGIRYILPSGLLMSHRAYVGGLDGQFPGELNSRIKMLMESTEELDKVAAKRVGISLEDYKKLIHDELWLTGSKAVELNHADEVVQAVCDKSLSGTNIQEIRSFFGTFKVEFSNCPLITGPISVKGNNEQEEVEYLNSLKDLKGRIKTTF